MQEDERQLQIEEVVQPVLLDHGLTLVDLEFRPRRPRGVLRLFVDKPGGVGIDDCQRVSRELGDVAGKRVRCWLAGGEEVRGRLVGIDDDQVVIERDGAEVRLTRASITKAKLDADVPWDKRAAQT
jgi:ribosome maturation factor RimP